MFAAILVALLSTALGSLAAPLPLPMPLALMAPAYSNRLYSTRQTLNWSSSSHDLGGNLTTNAIPLDPYNAGYTIRQQRALDTLTELFGHYSKAKGHSTKLTNFAAQSADIDEDDVVFQQNAAAELAGFDSSLLGIKTILDQLGAEKGLMNYDRTNDLETLLKNVVNFNKETLNAVDVLVYNLPILGPILGPSEPHLPALSKNSSNKSLCSCL
ncbi:hypothetical protein BKA70DRAFT_332451 [Coprinopsis sp. MPI-PUGE-AT-0042]|nr:hypothetical protein BKA70DRAFT_332451 [Coprinopsis sp. MPI-PUGE-AT-0042]